MIFSLYMDKVIQFENKMDPLQSLWAFEELDGPLCPIFLALSGSMSIIGKIHFLDFFENIRHAKNHIERILFEMFS